MIHTKGGVDLNNGSLVDPYCVALSELPIKLKEAYSLAVSGGELSLEGKEITRQVLARLQAYYLAQKSISGFLGKHYMTAASDFFVETTLFYLRALNEVHRLGLEIASERQIAKKKRALRPDITLWRGASVVAAIECKTQLGWDRTGWENEFSRRERLLQETHPQAKSFLLVMTSQNWGGFGASPLLGEKYFVLFNEWPANMGLDDMDSGILTPMESLFRHIVKMGTMSP